MLVGYNLGVWQCRGGAGWIGRKKGGGSKVFRLVTIRFLAFHSSKLLT